MKRTRMIKQIADKFREKGITKVPTRKEFNELGLMHAYKVRRLFGSFRRAMVLVFNELKEPISKDVEDDKVNISDEQNISEEENTSEAESSDKLDLLKEALEKAKESKDVSN